MAWTSPLTASSGGTLTAAQFNAHIRDNLMVTEVAMSSFEGNLIMASGTNTLQEMVPGRDETVHLDTTTSTSYTDLLDLEGPSVTVTCMTGAIAWWSCRMGNDTSNATTSSSLSVLDGTGTEVIAPLDARSNRQGGVAGGNDNKYGVCQRFSGFSPGVFTFTMKYRVSSGIGSFQNRELTVIPT